MFYQFMLITNAKLPAKEGQPNPAHALADLLSKPGNRDTMLKTYNDTVYLDFNRNATSFKAAVLAAINDVESCVGCKVVAVDGGDMVSLSDIEQLTGITRSALSRYSTGSRGGGTFPVPIRRLGIKTHLWRLGAVLHWLKDNTQHDIAPELVDRADASEAINLALAMRDNKVANQVYALMKRIA